MNKDNNKSIKESKAENVALVCFSHLRWDFVYQRPQHLMSRAAQERNVYFIEEPAGLSEKPRFEAKQDDSGVTVLKPFLPEGLDPEATNAALKDLIDQFFKENGITSFIAWYYTPMALDFTRHLKPALTVFDCMDELSLFKGAPKALINNETELLERADVVFTGGQSLYEAKRHRHENIHPFPSSIDAKHFGRARDKQKDPADQANIPHPRMGFFGVIDERMDIELIGQLAKARPEWHLVILGPVVKIDPASLPREDNIHYLGMKTYKELPAYLAGWDVALLPFALNDSTRFISPTKTPEYLSGGKPVVSTPITDVVEPYGNQNLISIASTADEFVQAIENILSRKESEKTRWLAKADKFLSQNSWDYTWKQMLTLIESSMYANEEKEKKINGPTKVEDRPIATMPLIPVEIDMNKEGAIPARMNGSGSMNGSVQPFDYLIVGAGFAGSVLAERLAVGSGKKVLLIDKRPHIAGNAYDEYSPDGILIHKYGPHIFHTNSKEVFSYLSRFTEWRPYEHRVLASVDGQLLPMPINLDTINKMYGLHLNAFELEEFFKKMAEPREKILTSEDVVVSKVGRELYEKFFRNYTRKQWDLDPSELDASVTSRVPIRFNRDGRYFTDAYQFMPLNGYTRMFQNLLDHPNIKIMLNTDYHEIQNMVSFREMIFTGPVDEYFDFAYGKLPYRSLDFQFKTLNMAQNQPVAVINYPNDNLYTRVTEFKHLTGQVHDKTTLVYEYPSAVGDPYYPIPRSENAALYARYQKLANAATGVYFAGRLATYKYYNMDQVVAQALNLYSKIEKQERTKAATVHTPHYVTAAVREREPESEN